MKNKSYESSVRIIKLTNDRKDPQHNRSYKLYSLAVCNLRQYVKLLAKSVLGTLGENHSRFFVCLVSTDLYFVRSQFLQLRNHIFLMNCSLY